MKRHFLSLSLVILAILFVACRSRSGDPGSASLPGASAIDAGAFDKAALLRALGECVATETRGIEVATAALDRAVKQASTDRSQASIDAARTQFQAVMTAWQRAELYQFGPAAPSTSPGGRNLRDPIYAWPLVGRCLVEQTLVSKAYEAQGWAASALVSTKSLAALEVLLFSTDTKNGCPEDSTINTSGAWAALSADELLSRRLAYAAVISSEVAERVKALADAWDPAVGGFVNELASAGRSGAYRTESMAFNAITDAMFYLDLQVKNDKVGKPAGLVPGCAAPPCLANVESPYAKRSKDNLRSNLDGFERLFRGCGPDASGLGLDDLLNAVGAEAVAAKGVASIGEVRAALDALTEPTFEEDLQKNPAGVQRLFDALRSNAVLMKTEVVTILDLELPKVVEGDND
jgi:predicted lipoprotein